VIFFFRPANPKTQTLKETFMSSLKAKDRVSLCLFTFSDGRRCRTPRIASHPHFCLYHARKEAQSLATQKLSQELTYFFSGSYLTACDLSTALSRILPAVVRGDVKPKTARTIAHLAQTLLQSIRISQHEFINAYSTDAWRNAVRDSVKSDRDYLFPPKPAPPSAPPPNATVSSSSTPPITTALSASAPSPVPAPVPPRAPQNAATPIQASTLKKCHSERNEEPAFPHPAANRSQSTSTPAPATSQAQPIPAPQPAPQLAPPPQPNNPPKATPQTPQQYFDPKTGGLHFDHNYRLTIDGKPWDGKPL
jgi:hypothetical protein